MALFSAGKLCAIVPFTVSIYGLFVPLSSDYDNTIQMLQQQSTTTKKDRYNREGDLMCSLLTQKFWFKVMETIKLLAIVKNICCDGMRCDDEIYAYII